MKVGDLKRQQILETAKEEFYENGYTKAKMKHITEKLGVMPSSITYYYKSKDNLLAAIYGEAYTKITERIKAAPVLVPNSLLEMFIRTKLWYRILFSNEQNKRIFYEAQLKESNYRLMNDATKEYFWKIVREFDVIITPFEMDLILKTDYAGRREFFIEYLMTDDPTVNFNDSLNLMETLVPKMFNIEQSIIDKAMLNSIKIANTIDVSDIKLFK